MSDQVFTRCPGCATVFRVSPAQLALREGQVRCGHCRAVFDANEQRVALDAPPIDDLEVPDELAAGRPTVTLRNADALQPATMNVAAPEAPVAAQAAHAADAPAADAPATDAPATDAPAAVTQIASAASPSPPAPATMHDADTATARPVDEARPRTDRFEWRPRKPLRERPQALYGLALVLLVAALVAQAVLEYRDALAAHMPFTRPLLEGACAVAGCTVGPARDAAALSIDASDLQADPAHRGLLKLTATLRNRASYRIAWPYLELTLTDASDRVVVRRAFAPSEYMGAAADAAHGLEGNGEALVTLFLDASETSQAGYRVYLFYP